MAVDVPRPALKSHKALVIGIANEHSIAYGCAKAFRELGADVAITYLNDKARPHVEPLARALDASIFVPLDVATEGALEKVFDEVKLWEGKRDHVEIFTLELSRKPEIRIDYREVIAAGWFSPEQALTLNLFPPIRTIIQARQAAKAAAAG